MINKKIVLASRPEGQPKESDFKVIEEELPDEAHVNDIIEQLLLIASVFVFVRVLKERAG